MNLNHIGLRNLGLEIFLNEVETREFAPKQPGTAIHFECADETVAKRITQNVITMKLYQTVGKNRFAVMIQSEKASPMAVHELSFGIPKIDSRKNDPARFHIDPEVALWLDTAGYLNDNQDHPRINLRKLLRSERVKGDE